MNFVATTPPETTNYVAFTVRWARRLLFWVVTLVVLIAATATGLYACIWMIHRWQFPGGWWLWVIGLNVSVPLILLYYFSVRSLIRNKWRFSTRALLIAMSLLGVVLGAFGHRFHAHLRQQRAVWEVTRRGGRITNDSLPHDRLNWLHWTFGYDPLQEVRELDVRRNDVLDALLENHEGFEQLSSISFHSTSDEAVERAAELIQFPQLVTADVLCPLLTDQGLHSLCQWTSLRRLNLNGCTKITDEGLAHLEKLTNLELLFVISAGRGKLLISDQGLASIGKLRSIKSLYLGESGITDAGLRQLVNLSELEKLSLRKVDITDAGLTHLASLRNLKVLGLYETKVTGAGLKQLAEALPNCSIHCDRPGWWRHKANEQ